MKPTIFYGAGKFAEENIHIWAKDGLTPVCFADADRKKHGKALENVSIFSLKEALSRYPAADIYVTVGVDALGRVTNYLSKEWQIPTERIKYPYPVESRLGCKLIGTRIQFFGESYSTCCSPKGGFLKYTDSFEENMEGYERFCSVLLSKLRLEEKTDCDGCAQLRYDIWPVKPRLEVIGFDTAFEEDRCNFNCIYCGVKQHMVEKSLNHSLIHTMKKFEEYSKGEYRNIVLASGEISVSPYRDEVFAIIKRNRWDVSVFTNASVYVPVLAELIAMGRAKIQVSMDAGTKGTFARIKRADAWTKVTENLSKYSQYAIYKGQIELKYILLPGVNDNEEDIEGFIALAESLNANVMLSSDMRIMDLPLPEKTYSCALRLARACGAKGIHFTPVTEFFNPQSYSRLVRAIDNG